EDSAYPACELNSQGPAARGWRSDGAAPHELLLRLTSVTSVHKLQLLAHHQLIQGAATPCGAIYTSVGKVTLARPTAQARTRELRSAALPEPTIARFVKLKLSGPHPPAQENEQSSPLPGACEPTYSPYDDLAFVMYVDTEIADLVRSLDDKKKAAVTEERFEYARRLKSAGAALAGAGIRIGRWRLRKRTAAPDRRNDSSMPAEYDFSHHLSPSVAAGSLNLDIPSPVPPIIDPGEEYEDGNEEEINNEPEQPHSVPFQSQPQSQTSQIQFSSQYNQPPEEKLKEEIQRKVEEEELRKETDSPRRSITPNAANGTLVRRRNKSAGPRSTFEAYEERLLPALRHSHTNEYLREAREEEASGGSATSHPRTTHHKLNERERKQAALPILIFGDKVFSVYSQANEVVRTLFHEFVPDRVCAAEVGRCLEKLLPELLRACGDPAPRVHSTAQHTVLTVAECPHVRCLEKQLPELLRACGDPVPRVHSTAQHTVLTVIECPHVRSGQMPREAESTTLLNTPCSLSQSVPMSGESLGRSGQMPREAIDRTAQVL
ncbi:Uncharacterized protein OBRU01_15552, partial [Operophtera brumata]